MKSRSAALFPLGLAACALQLSACATVTRTEHADWKVDTIPQGAALSSSNGGHCDATPCTLRVRRKESFTATLTKDGYVPLTLNVKPTLTAQGGTAFAGNILIGGLIGMGVDIYTGATLDPHPAGTPFRLTPTAYANNPDPQSLFKPVPAAFASVPAPARSMSAAPAPLLATARGSMPVSSTIARRMTADCPPEKAKYAAFLGVTCASLGDAVSVTTPAARNR